MDITHRNQHNVQGTTKSNRQRVQNQTRTGKKSWSVKSSIRPPGIEGIRCSERPIRATKPHGPPIPNNNPSRSWDRQAASDNGSPKRSALFDSKYESISRRSSHERVQSNRHDVIESPRLDMNKIDSLLQRLTTNNKHHNGHTYKHNNEILRVFDLKIEELNMKHKHDEVYKYIDMHITIRGFCANKNQWHNEISIPVSNYITENYKQNCRLHLHADLSQLIVLNYEDVLFIIAELYSYISTTFADMEFIQPKSPSVQNTCIRALDEYLRRRANLFFS